MEPLLHLHLHQSRVDAVERRHRVLGQPRPRPPGRHAAADVLRRVADRLDAPEVRPEARPEPRPA